MDSTKQGAKYVRRINPIFGTTWLNISSKLDFTQCEISTDKVERGESLMKVWCLKNISSRSNLEALASSGGCVFGFEEGAKKIQLRFFLKPENYSFEKGKYNKHFSLMCETLNGGERKQLSFAVIVDKLSETRQFERTVVTERAVIIDSEKDPQGTVVQSVFLPYLTSQMRINGQFYNTEYHFASLKELNFGFSVTQLQCTGKVRNGNPRTFYPKLESFESE